MLDRVGYRHTHSECNTYCVSVATMVTRTPLNVTLYVYCLSFYIYIYTHTHIYIFLCACHSVELLSAGSRIYRLSCVLMTAGRSRPVLARFGFELGYYHASHGNNRHKSKKRVTAPVCCAYRGAAWCMSRVVVCSLVYCD
jgi:hypothetical protein